MWTRFAERLRCPISHAPLHLHPIRRESVQLDPAHLAKAQAAGITVNGSFNEWVDQGVLVSEAGWAYPITRGLPILLTYRTPIHDEFEREAAQQLKDIPAHRFPEQEAAPGERDVLRSFSEEWRNYEYDGVLWDVSYDDNFARLVAEVGLPEGGWAQKTWLEVGCGIGMTTAQAHSLSGSDAVGMDLSFAVFKASQQFRANPFLHFVQASAFAPPFASGSFDILYSRGVLHHTHSTRRAFLAVAPLARAGGRVYLWVYGPGSLMASPLRLAAFSAEAALRPILCRVPPPLATAFLTPIAAAYLAFNAFRRNQEPQVQKYTFDRALHAARDRFTPRYAYRQGHAEVMQWFREAGIDCPEAVDAAAIPPADRDDYRRNTGVRGNRA
jgi:SAM-dependent methyltransferase